MKSIQQFDSSHAVQFSVWVEKGPSCWEWQGRVTPSGYGLYYGFGFRAGAHRVAWMLANGPIPEGLVIDHMCHNILCVNPEHLRACTPKQNIEHMKPVRARSGYRGVQKNGTRWCGVVKHNYERHHTKQFDTPEEANDAVIELRNKLFTHNLLDRV